MVPLLSALRKPGDTSSSTAATAVRVRRVYLVLYIAASCLVVATEARVESVNLRENGISQQSSQSQQQRAAANNNKRRSSWGTDGTADRLLFWSSYDFNIDAATQQLGPLDLFVRGGSSIALQEVVGQEEEEEEDEDEDTFEPIEDFSSLSSSSSSSDQPNSTTTTITTTTSCSAAAQDSSSSLTTTTTTTTLSNNKKNWTSSFTTSLSVRGGKQRASAGKAVAPLKYTLFQPKDGSETDPDGIPTRFLRMHNDNRVLAKQAVTATLEWRRQHNIDQLLNQPQVKFDLCKAVFPHYFLGRDHTGHVVFLQHPARIDMELAARNGLKDEDLLMHYVFVNEYLWQVIEKDAPLATMISVLDLQGLNFGILRQTELLGFVKKFVSTMDSFYPQRSHKTLILNCPKWFSAFYKLVSPLMRETTKAKIEIYTRGKGQDDALKRYLGEDAIKALPESFWSKWTPPKARKAKKAKKEENGSSEGESSDDEPLLEIIVPPKSKLEEELRAFVVARVEAAGLKMQPVL